MQRFATAIFLTAFSLLGLAPSVAAQAKINDLNSTIGKPAHGQKTVVYKGIGLSPAIENIETAPGQPAPTFKVKLQNFLNTPVTLNASSLDFKALNETGGVAFVGANAGQLEHKYGLANWLVTPTEPITLAPHSAQEVQLGIDNRDDLAPGGHYAAVLFKNAATVNGANSVAVNQVLAMLVFLKKSGGEIYNLQLQDPGFHTTWWHFPSNVNLFFHNNGNVQAIPRGTVTINDPAGRQFQRGIVNIDSGMVLPGSTRYFRTDLFGTSHAWLPGKYKAIVTYRADSQADAKTAEYSFFYFNLVSLLLLVLGVVAIVTLIRWLKARKVKQKDIHSKKSN